MRYIKEETIGAGWLKAVEMVMENGNESWFWEHPITKEIQVFSSKEERDKKEREYQSYKEMVDETSNQGEPWVPPGI